MTRLKKKKSLSLQPSDLQECLQMFGVRCWGEGGGENASLLSSLGSWADGGTSRCVGLLLLTKNINLIIFIIIGKKKGFPKFPLKNLNIYIHT